MTALDVEAIRKEFPGLHQKVNGKPLVYLDSGATAHCPQPVLDALMRANTVDRANVHRGVHEISQRASAAFEEARRKVAGLVGATDEREIVFTRGTTEAINLVAQSWGASLRPGDEVVITAMEHHSNLVPWQMACERTGATLRVIRHDECGVLRMDEAAEVIGPKTRLVAAVHVSNSLGTVNPIRALADLAHEQGAVLVVDAAQSVPHMPVDVAALGADFLAFSGHKLGAPFGIGALWGRRSLLENMPPWQGGGGMIADVRLDRTLYGPVPMRFEAGTPDVGGAVGLGAAVDYVRALGLDQIAAWEGELLRYATARLLEVPGLKILGTSPEKAAVVSFVIQGAPASDVGTLLDQKGIAVRTGHHCTQPVMDFFGVSATLRASFAYYNTRAEVDALVDGLIQIRSWL